jgi:hypothetical protein
MASSSVALEEWVTSVQLKETGESPAAPPDRRAALVAAAEAAIARTLSGNSVEFVARSKQAGGE